MKNKKKLIALVLLLAMLIGATVGGTVAWLVTSTEPVVNTFTVGNINIDLDESVDSEFQMVPGAELPKDPSVTVKEGSEKCWVFVRIDESTNLEDFITYEVADTWICVEDRIDYAIYAYEEVVTHNNPIYILEGKGTDELKNGYVTVNSDVTKEDMDALTDATLPTLTFTAYAIQADNLKDSKDRVPKNVFEVWQLYNGEDIEDPV